MLRLAAREPIRSAQLNSEQFRTAKDVRVAPWQADQQTTPQGVRRPAGDDAGGASRTKAEGEVPMCGIRRREFITMLGGAPVVWPLAVGAQQNERMRRIGVLMNLAADDPEGQARVAALLEGLRQLGWTDGENVRI